MLFPCILHNLYIGDAFPNLEIVFRDIFHFGYVSTPYPPEGFSNVRLDFILRHNSSQMHTADIEGMENVKFTSQRFDELQSKPESSIGRLGKIGAENHIGHPTPEGSRRPVDHQQGTGCHFGHTLKRRAHQALFIDGIFVIAGAAAHNDQVRS